MRGTPYIIATKQDLEHLCRDLLPDDAKKALCGLTEADLRRLGIGSADVAELKSTLARRRRGAARKATRMRETWEKMAECERAILELRTRIAAKSGEIRALTRMLTQARAEWKKLNARLGRKEV